MKITFHGAAQTVTGSKHLLSLESGQNILLDCGMFQGMGKDTYALNKNLGFNPIEIDFLILSHAHIDHSGLIPLLAKEGFSGKIFCTQATYDLCEIMLADSAHIQEADIRFINKRKRSRGKEEITPLYALEDVKKCLELFITVECNQEYKVDDFVKLTFTDNGHILGSAAVNLKILEGSEWKRICFTGDIGRYDTALLKDPQSFPQADVIICESTYGDRLHDHIGNAEQHLLDAVLKTCSKKKGKLIIPAFSLGRTQEIVYALNKLDLHGLLPDIKFYVDSPLAVNATNITRKHVNLLNDRVREFTTGRPDPFGFDDLIYVREKQESQKLNAMEHPCVIISSAGMAEAGRVKHHIKHNIKDPSNTILIVGYAEPLSLAGRLRAGHKEVTIFGEPHVVNAEVIVIDAFSAHGDYNEMIKYLSCQNSSEVNKMFLVHGELPSQLYFKEELKKVGFNNVHIPDQHSSYYI